MTDQPYHLRKRTVEVRASCPEESGIIGQRNARIFDLETDLGGRSPGKHRQSLAEGVAALTDFTPAEVRAACDDDHVRLLKQFKRAQTPAGEPPTVTLEKSGADQSAVEN